MTPYEYFVPPNAPISPPRTKNPKNIEHPKNLEKSKNPKKLEIQGQWDTPKSHPEKVFKKYDLGVFGVLRLRGSTAWVEHYRKLYEIYMKFY